MASFFFHLFEVECACILVKVVDMLPASVLEVSFLVPVSLDLHFDFPTTSVYRPATCLELFFLLENAEEMKVTEEKLFLCWVCCRLPGAFFLAYLFISLRTFTNDSEITPLCSQWFTQASFTRSWRTESSGKQGNPGWDCHRVNHLRVIAHWMSNRGKAGRSDI